MKLVYIACPYMSQEESQIQRNIENARSWAVRMANAGIGFFCPHIHTANFHVEAEAEEHFYKDLDMEMLKKCDAIVLIEGWRNSSGSKAEREYAVLTGMPIFEWPMDFWDFLVRWYHE